MLSVRNLIILIIVSTASVYANEVSNNILFFILTMYFMVLSEKLSRIIKSIENNEE